MTTTFARHVARSVAAFVSTGIIALATMGMAGVANAAVTPMDHGPVNLPNSSQTKSVTATMMLRMQSWSAAYSFPTKVDASPASIYHTGPVVPPSMKWNEQDNKLAPVADSTPTEIDTSSIYHTGPVVPPSMKWNEQDNKLAPVADSTPTEIDTSSIYHTGPVIPPTMKWNEQDNKLAPVADSTPTEIDTSPASIYHTGPVNPPTMNFCAETAQKMVSAAPDLPSHR